MDRHHAPTPSEEPLTPEAARREAARLLGKATSPAKTAAARANARKGGRPKGIRLSTETKQKISEAKRRKEAEPKQTKKI